VDVNGVFVGAFVKGKAFVPIHIKDNKHLLEIMG